MTTDRWTRVLYSGRTGIRWKVHFVLMMGGMFMTPIRALAHDGPPYPVVVDKDTKICRVSVWADPDVGIGTLYVTLETASGRTASHGVRIDVTATRKDGKAPEVRSTATPDTSVSSRQYIAKVPFETEGRWLTRVRLTDAGRSVEIPIELDVTPPGNSPLYLVWYFFPMGAMGFLWAKAFLHGRGTRSGGPSARAD